MDSILCTICTPTYNRAYILKNLYQSLLKQTNKNFEWIIVDDGSSDDTKLLVDQFLKDNIINISYFYKENGGKHRAVNFGIDKAKGKYFAIVDSDDWLTDDAVENICDKFKPIDSDESFCGISFNRGYSENKIIGKTFSGDFIDATSIERNKYNILGDKFEVFRTSILKDNKFPEIEGENFLSEIILWTRIAYQGYKIRWYNKIIYICDYLDDGLTKNNDKLLEKNYKGNALRIREQVSLANIGLKAKLGYYSKYYQLRKNSEKFSVICDEINANPIVVFIAVIIRKLLRR